MKRQSLIKTKSKQLSILLYKAEMTSVRLSDRHVDSSVVSAWIDVGLGLCTAMVSGM